MTKKTRKQAFLPVIRKPDVRMTEEEKSQYVVGRFENIEEADLMDGHEFMEKLNNGECE